MPAFSQQENWATLEMVPQTETSSVKGGRKGMNEKYGDSAGAEKKV